MDQNNGDKWARMGEHMTKLVGINYFHNKNISRKFDRNLMTKNRYILENMEFR